MSALSDPASTFVSELTRFITVGITITLANIILYIFLTQSVDLSPPVSSAISFVAVIPPHFLAYSKLVFDKHSASSWTLVRYAVALALSCLVSVKLVWFYWSQLMADPLAAQALALPVAVFVNYCLFKYWVFRDQSPTTPVVKFSITGLAAVIAVAAAYFASAAIVLYTHPEPRVDDWRHLNDYFFLRDAVGSIFGRQNGHLLIGPQALMYANQMLLNGRMSNLALVNVGLLGLQGLVAAAAADTTLKHRGAPTNIRYATACLIVAFPFALLQPVTQFWSLGIHNHMATLGATVAALVASGLTGRLDRPKTILLFILAATLAGTSFSAGAAAWALGFLGAVAVRTSWRIVGLYFLIGVFGAALCLGVKPPAASIDQTLNVLTVIRDVFVAVGNAPAWLVPHLTEAVRLHLAFWIGAFCTAVIVASGMLHMIETRDDPMNRGASSERFFILICAFALIAAVLISLGRAGIEYATLYPRFSTWSAMFYLGLFGFVVLELQKRTSCTAKNSTIYSVALLVSALALLTVNVWVVDRRIRHFQTNDVRLVAEIAVNRDERPTATPLWLNKSDVWVAVIRQLRQQRTNLFADDWSLLFGEQVPRSAIGTRRTCAGQFFVSKTRRPDEWLVRGWVFTTGGGSKPISVVLFANSAGEVQGFALPTFARHQWRRTPLYAAHLPYWVSVAQSLRLPVIGDLPGAAGGVLGIVRRDAANATEVEKGLVAVASSRDHTWCRVTARPRRAMD